MITVEVIPPYPVYVEPGLLARVGEHVQAPAVALVSDEAVAPLYADRVQEGLEAAGKRTVRYLVPVGEASKSTRTFGDLLSRLAQDGFNRRSAVLALGGGVVSDLAGFVAASFMRGIDFYICPTNLLGMVDASVGGKTGLNLPEGKNLVGAFWQPKAVLMDVTTLRSLPTREFRGGAVELFKHGLLADLKLLDAVESPHFRPDGPLDFWVDTVARSVRVKAEVVAEDVLEAGRRAHLNLGHTLGHALEAYTDHRLSHGEAVAYGLLFAARLSAARGCADETARVLDFLRWVAPAPLPKVPFTVLEPFIARDKKHTGSHAGAQRWVLLERPGSPRLVEDVTTHELEAAWAYLQEVTG